MAKSVNNTPQGWQALSKEYFSGATKDQDIIATIGPSEQANGDVTVLRYFFPLAHGLHESGIIPYGNPVRLYIDTSSIKEKNKVESIMRLKAFLTATGKSSDYEIYIDNIRFRGNAAKWDGRMHWAMYSISCCGMPELLISFFRRAKLRNFPPVQY